MRRKPLPAVPPWSARAWQYEQPMDVRRELKTFVILLAVGTGSSGCVTGAMDGASAPAVGQSDINFADDHADGSRAGSGSEPDGDEGGEDDLGPDDACTTCVEDNCGATVERCSENAECVALADCGERCADDACYGDCERAHADGTDDLMAYFDCIESSCENVCGGGDAAGDAETGAGGDDDDGGGDDGGGDADPVDACDACAQQSCAAPYEECMSNDDCLAFLECTDQCADETCWQNCERDHGEGVELFYSLDDCVYGACQADCGY